MGSAPLAGARRSASLLAFCTFGACLLVGAAVPARAQEPSPSPEPVRLPPILAFAVGDEHGCALVEGGDVWCSGRGFHGQLGDGTMESSDVPVRVMLPRPAVAIEAGGDSSCAITDDGGAWCWGANAYGQLGIGTQVDTGVPTRLALPGPAVALAFGMMLEQCRGLVQYGLGPDHLRLQR